eukprot:4493757-Pleurochrysis_carterae.AAC.2
MTAPNAHFAQRKGFNKVYTACTPARMRAGQTVLSFRYAAHVQACTCARKTAPVCGSRRRICASYCPPPSTASTAAAASVTSRHWSRTPASSSITTSNIGGRMRCGTCLEGGSPFAVARFADLSPTTTFSHAPTRLLVARLLIKSRSVPCAEAMTRTPLRLAPSAASASFSRPISSSTITCGVWFCTHSSMTDACVA